MQNGEQMPKATMANFVRNNVKMSFSAEFVQQYIVRMSDRANEVCLESNKKTINVEHLQHALIGFGLQHHIDPLRVVAEGLKQMQQVRKETNQRIEEDMQRERDQKDHNKPLSSLNVVEVKAQFNQIKVHSSSDSEEDYEAMDHDLK